VKGMWIFFQTFLVFVCTVAVAFANEPKPAGDPYAALYYAWWALAGFIFIWGVYDSFVRPLD